jgi:hypothetical protein
VPIEAACYERIRDGLGDEPPAGLIIHLAVEQPEGGVRYYDVWETEADFERFAEERLHPVVHPLLEEVFGDHLPDEPARVPLPVFHVWGAGTAPTLG